MKQLLEAGVHFGHQTRRWNPKMEKFIFTERNGIHIIDLQQTVTRLDEAVNFIRDLVAEDHEVLIVGTKKQARDTVFQEATRAGLPYVNTRWLGGTLTNWRTIQGRIRHLRDLEDRVERGEFIRRAKKEQLDINNEIDRLNRFFGGIKNMERLPAAVFIVDTVKESIAVAECDRLGIPIVSLVDSNCDPDPITHPIPSNDDAIRAIKLILGKICDGAVEGRAAAEAGVGAGVAMEDLVSEEVAAEAAEEASDAPEAPTAAEASAVPEAVAPTEPVAPSEPTQEEAPAAPEPQATTE